jgi:multidrug efflux pump subunit AcrA (membrane-fusion protein)
MKRAGIVVAPVTSGSGTAHLRLPGVVEPNAYKQVIVTPIVGGRVRRVLVELGQSVRWGQPMAEIFSPDLAEAETRFVSARAELDAHERELQRTQKLTEIGAASRQDLEMLHAAHTAKLTALDSARTRLELLGLSAASINSLGPGKDLSAVTTVPAPIAGIVTERAADFTHAHFECSVSDKHARPDPVHELVLRDQSTRLLDQILEHAERLRRERNGRRVARQRRVRLIEAEISERERH